MAIGGENGETVGGDFRAAECLGSHYKLRVKECFCGGLSWAHFNMLQHGIQGADHKLGKLSCACESWWKHRPFHVHTVLDEHLLFLFLYF